MSNLTKKAIRDGRTDGWTDPNYRKASLLKITVAAVELFESVTWFLNIIWNLFTFNSNNKFWEKNFFLYFNLEIILNLSRGDLKEMKYR